MVQGATGARTGVGSTVSDNKEEGAAGLVTCDGAAGAREAAASRSGLGMGGERVHDARGEETLRAAGRAVRGLGQFELDEISEQTFLLRNCISFFFFNTFIVV